MLGNLVHNKGVRDAVYRGPDDRAQKATIPTTQTAQHQVLLQVMYVPLLLTH